MKFKLITEELKKATPYMLRNDGELIDCSPMHPYINYITETDDESLYKLSRERLRSLKFLYENTKEKRTAENVQKIVNYLIRERMIDSSNEDVFDITEDTEILFIDEIYKLIDSVNRDLNQEFLRMRTSNMLFGGRSNSVYFRISSVRFNWFDIIWNFVYRNKNFISDVSIVKDTATFGGSFKPYVVSGKEIFEFPVDEFITLSGNPIVESLKKSDIEAINDAVEDLKKGKTFSEAFYYMHPAHVEPFYKRIVEDFLEDDIQHLLRKSK